MVDLAINIVSFLVVGAAGLGALLFAFCVILCVAGLASEL